MANTQFMSFIIDGLTGSTADGTITLSQENTAAVGEWLSSYILGDWLLASVYLFASDGRRALVGIKEIQVTAA
jgi:hypothetical protein